MRDEAVHAVLLAEQQRLELERMSAEARLVASWDRQRRSEYLKAVSKQRGAEAGDKLRAAVAEQQKEIAE